MRFFPRFTWAIFFGEISHQKPGWFPITWLFPKIMVPPNHPILIGFSIIFTIHFGGNTPIFGNTHIFPCRQPPNDCWMNQLWPSVWRAHLQQESLLRKWRQGDLGAQKGWGVFSLKNAWRIVPGYRKYLVTPNYKP